MGGIGVVSNPQSGLNRRRPQLAQDLAYILGSKGRLHEPKAMDHLHEVARHFLEEGVEVLCVNGGDGTTHRVLTAFLEVYGEKPLPKVGVLRGGTINNLARTIGLRRGRPEELLGHIVGRYHASEEFEIVEKNLVVVDGKQAGFLFGNGLIASFMEAYYEGGSVGTWKAVRVLGRTIASAIVGGPFIRRMTRPVEADVKLDGARIDMHRFVSIGIASITHLGLGFHPFHEMDRHPDRIQVLCFGCPVIGIVQALPYYYTKQPSPRPDILSDVVRCVEMESDRPLSFQIDGDFHPGGNTMKVEVGPRVRLIAG